ncbi:hypothetical protein WH50_09725 [Pokkaliibacter plantistimulans]|uniref:NAD-dependent dehydratase n=1 Tax=Pokkaliibacter plantistimulans TaxID=1635171 RepID=A0ABX5LXR5_9GAMM|nr:DoxX-like family protein [Pokkaliibacter plantistimulans]PXF31465.1 hypothetical protein WH50_09725 [Pokkaliibacter plantistimulans]
MSLSLLLSLGRASLILLWLFTGVTSTWLAPQLGMAVLQQAGLNDQQSLHLIWLGSGVDVLMGLWLMSGWQRRWCYYLQLVLICVYTLLLSLLAPVYWLDPFGPVSKNLPLLALILLLNWADQHVTTR